MSVGVVKEFEISKTNRIYYDEFLARFGKQSRATYKVDAGAFLSELGTNDFAKVTPARIQRYIDSRRPGQQKNAAAHLRSMMMYVVKRDINGAAEKVKKETLIWLLDSRSGGDLHKAEQLTIGL